MKTLMTLVGIQEEYIRVVNAGAARWSHRKDGGHSARIARGARHQAEQSLRRLGFSGPQIDKIIRDARDMATLERTSEGEDDDS